MGVGFNNTPSSQSALAGRAAVSDIALIASNAVPLFGVLVAHWAVFPIILLYWCENVVIGAMNVVKMGIAYPQQPVLWLVKVFLIPFFCVHYGLFTGVHGVFVFSLFGGPHYSHVSWPTMPIVLSAIRDAGIGWAIISLVGSHLVSFVWNFLIGGEFRRVLPIQLMSQPYARVVVLHVTLIFGGIAVMAIGAPVAALAVLVVVKTAVDLAAHRRERRKFLEPALSTSKLAIPG